VLFLTDANKVLKRYFTHSRPAEPWLYWILDQNGRIVHFPRKVSEPLMQHIGQKDFSKCSGCHVSMSDGELDSKSGTHVIPYPPGKKSLVAWSTAHFLDQSWTIVLTLPSSDINRLLNDRSISARTYLFFAIGMVALFLIFNFVNLHRQVLLEAEKKVLQNDLAATEKIRAMENALEKVQRLEGLSVLAGGLAHEINNPITNIVLYSRLVRQRVEDPGVISDLEIIERESKKIKFIVFDMLSYIRRTNAGDKPKSINLNDLVGELLEINSAILRKSGILVQYELQRELPLVMADGNKIMQVMVNIFNNAMDAVKEGGKIILQTGSEGLPTETRNVFFAVSDNGAGIPPDLREKVFELFYTTKPAGVGTGLGLPVSKAIVEKMGGRITLNSAPGQGTTVKVILPLL
jgi:signal transduction histidine kinase